MRLKTGHKVVHKTHGVGTISGTETKNYGAGLQEYYLLKIDATGLIVRFPIGGESSIIRGLVTESEIATIFSILRGPARTYSMVWNRRKKEFLEKIRSGSLYEIAEVLRDLNSRKIGRELSFGEKEMMERARERLINEISAAKALEREEIGEQLDHMLVLQ